MKILVTGALGHVGSRLIRELPLSFPGSEIVLVDNLSTQRYTSLFNLPTSAKYQFVEANVESFDAVPLVKHVDAVIHLAAITNATDSFQNKEKVEKVNFGATSNIAEACARTKRPLIHLSTTSVYGKTDNAVDESCPDSVLQPQSPYAETKLKEEKLLFQMGKEKGLRFTICRFGTIFGTSPGIRFHTAVNKFCWQAVMNTPVTVWRTALHQVRPYLDLSDAVRAIEHILKTGLFTNQIYNVVTLNATVDNILSAIRQFVPGLQVKLVDSEIMNQLSYEVLSQKFSATGFKSRGNLTSGIEDTIKLLKNAHPQPNQNVQVVSLSA